MCHIYESQYGRLRILKFEKYEKLFMKTWFKNLFTSRGRSGLSGSSGALPATFFLDCPRALMKGTNPLLLHSENVNVLSARMECYIYESQYGGLRIQKSRNKTISVRDGGLTILWPYMLIPKMASRGHVRVGSGMGHPPANTRVSSIKVRLHPCHFISTLMCDFASQLVYIRTTYMIILVGCSMCCVLLVIFRDWCLIMFPMTCVIARVEQS